MAKNDYRNMTVDQLNEALGELKKEQFNLRFQQASGQLENTGRIRQVRRDIARVKTALSQIRIGLAAAAKGESNA